MNTTRQPTLSEAMDAYATWKAEGQRLHAALLNIWRALGDRKHMTFGDDPAAVEAEVYDLLRFAQHLASEAITPMCEVAGDGPGGACPEDAVAIRWEHGFADSVCEQHAQTAIERDAVVVYAKRHIGEG